MMEVFVLSLELQDRRHLLSGQLWARATLHTSHCALGNGEIQGDISELR